MKIAVEDTYALLVADDTLVQNSSKAHTVEFVFSSGWKGFSKTAIFEAGPASVIVILSEDRCIVPAECLKRGSVKLKIGIYGVKENERKGTVWCLAGMVIPDSSMDIGITCPHPPTSDDVYNEIMAAIGDLAAAGFEGKTLAEVFKEIKDSTCGTATDKEVNDILNSTFGQVSTPPENPGEVDDSDNTATDKEVGDILNEVFGK